MTSFQCTCDEKYIFYICSSTSQTERKRERNSKYSINIITNKYKYSLSSSFLSFPVHVLHSLYKNYFLPRIRTNRKWYQIFCNRFVNTFRSFKSLTIHMCNCTRIINSDPEMGEFVVLISNITLVSINVWKTTSNGRATSTVLTHCKDCLICCRALATSLAKLPIAGKIGQVDCWVPWIHRD